MKRDLESLQFYIPITDVVLIKNLILVLISFRENVYLIVINFIKTL